VPIVLKSENLKHLEPSGPVQACNGIALHFLYMFLCLLATHIGAKELLKYVLYVVRGKLSFFESYTAQKKETLKKTNNFITNYVKY
jgi:hypothetical protein